ncbi:MAG: hypothetical protein RIE73_31835 [Coleofasciculus sp. C1-SOL-03]
MSILTQYVRRNGTDLRLVGNAHPTVYQRLQRSKTAYFSAIDVRRL